MSGSSRDVAELLRAWSAGDLAARDRLIPLVYQELHRCAAARLRREGRRCNLEPAELVHEAYLRLASERRAVWQSRGQLLAVASDLMRRILIDRGRARRAQKRWGGAVRLVSGPHTAGMRPDGVEMLDLKAALARLAAVDLRQSRIVDLRFFAGLSLGEAGHVMGLSIATVERDWQQARAWLFRALRTTRPTGLHRRSTSSPPMITRSRRLTPTARTITSL